MWDILSVSKWLMSLDSPLDSPMLHHSQNPHFVTATFEKFSFVCSIPFNPKTLLKTVLTPWASVFCRAFDKKMTLTPTTMANSRILSTHSTNGILHEAEMSSATVTPRPNVWSWLKGSRRPNEDWKGSEREAGRFLILGK